MKFEGFFFLSRNRKWGDRDWRGNAGGTARSRRRGKVNWNILYGKNLFLIKEKILASVSSLWYENNCH